MVRQGTKGVYVCTLQDALNTIGAYSVGVDGVFGPKTADAVRAFQRDNGLTADGIVGCSTWTALTKQANNYFRRSGAVPAVYAHE